MALGPCSKHKDRSSFKSRTTHDYTVKEIRGPARQLGELEHWASGTQAAESPLLDSWEAGKGF